MSGADSPLMEEGTIPVEQTLHGYQRGHQLLASSIDLEPADAELIRRLSDLSGILTPEIEFRPYLSAYPLPSGRFYAIAKTWLDASAPRAGCVLTHTLLVPIEAWEVLSQPAGLHSLLALPSEGDFDGYRRQLYYSDQGRPRESLSVIGERPLDLDAFVHAFFAQGHRPLTWFRTADADSLSWRILSTAWPALRRSIALCSFTLQPRSVDDRPFDVMFAPPATRSRFHRAAAGHVAIDTESFPSAKEPWEGMWSDSILSGTSPLNAAPAERQLFLALGSEPTEIRRFYMYAELRARAGHSAMAGIGALDLLAALAAQPTDATQLKHDTVSHILHSCEHATDLSSVLRVLTLLGRRLETPPFLSVGRKMVPRIRRQAERIGQQIPEEALEWLLSARNDTTVFSQDLVEGLFVGLERRVTIEPMASLALKRVPNIATAVIERSPLMALAFFDALETTSSEVDHRTFVEWISNVSSDRARRALRDAILPRIRSGRYLPLLNALTRGLQEAEVPDVLTTLADASSGFADELLACGVATRISVDYPRAVQRWARTANHFGWGTALVIAGSYAQDVKGLESLLIGEPQDSGRRADVLAAYIRLCGWQLCDHVRARVRHDDAVLSALLGAPTTRAEVTTAIANVLAAARDVPLSTTRLLENIDLFRDQAYFPSLLDLVFRGAVRNALRDHEWESLTCRSLGGPAGSEWLASVDVWDLRVALQPVHSKSRPSRSAAWRLIAAFPDAVFIHRPALIDELCRAVASHESIAWTHADGNTWGTVLQRSRKVARPDQHARLRAYAWALQFAFDHRSHPLGPVVEQAFAPVYAASVEDSSLPSELEELFAFLDWDRGKRLREDLVNAFLRSTWPAGGLAIAADDAGILSKIIHRVKRHKRGVRYLEAIVADLRDTQRAPDTLHKLLGLLRSDPREEWD